VEPGTAHRIASQHHLGQQNRFGDPVIDHVERVAAAVPADARATALLHDLFELCPTVRGRLRGQGLSQTELQALELLTHAEGEPYEVYVRRIADAPGPAGRIARLVKLADLEDHLAHPAIPKDAPPYAWARELLLAAGSNGAR
jgi:HD superfamily phosphodiesterase